MTDLSFVERLPAVPPRQLVVLLHGLGADGQDLISLADEWRSFLPEAAFIAPNAPFPCDMAPFGYQWFSLQEWTDEAVAQGARAASGHLNRFLDAQLARFALPSASMALVGFSQGTMMALHVGLRRPEAPAAIIGYSGALVDSTSLPDNITAPPVLLVHGDADMVVPFAAMAKAEAELRAHAVPVQTLRRPGLGHGIDHHGLHAGVEAMAEAFGLIQSKEVA